MDINTFPGEINRVYGVVIELGSDNRPYDTGQHDWDYNDFREVDQPPATCFMFKNKIINEVGLWDEKLFLFFNDVDFCLRIKQAGFKIYFTPKAQVIHYCSASLKKNDRVNEIWYKDKFSFYRKHYKNYSVLIIKLILWLDFIERTIKLPFKLLLKMIKFKQIPSHFLIFWKIIRS